MAHSRSVAAQYHRLTKYDEASIRTGPGLDWSRQPRQIKEIVSRHRVPLKPHTFGQHLRPEPAPARGPAVANLARLLFFTNGVTGTIRFPQGGRQILRAAPSAGALYPTEIYAAVGDLPGIEPGLYNYQVADHELVRLWEGDHLDAVRRACGGGAGLDAVYCFLVFTGVFWRSAWRYRERGYRRVLLDTGHALANLAAYAPHEGCAAPPHLAFLDADLNGLFFFEEGVEATLACVPVAPDAPAGALWASGTADGTDLQPAVLEDPDEVAASAGFALHRAAACAEPRPAAASGAPETDGSDGAIACPEPGALDSAMPEAILNRRSARGYQPGPIGADALGRALGFAFGRGGDAVPRTRTDGLLAGHVAALGVDGLDAGIYAVTGAGAALAPVERGDVRARLHHVSLGQPIAERCAAVLILSANADEAVARYGERAYRYLHLEAGLLGERFQLAATALGLTACGIGGFFDDDAAALVGRGPDDWVLYLVTIGRAQG